MLFKHTTLLRATRTLLLVGVAAATLGACANNRTSVADRDYTGMSRIDASASVSDLADSYKKRPRDKGVMISYAAALRSQGQADQASAVLESGIAIYPKDIDIRVAYAKALTAGGRFQQALAILDDVIDPSSPDWNALSVKGAVLDQMGRNEEARKLYQQALLQNPNEASLEANMGLSFAMTSDLNAAEIHLRKAVSMRGASSQIRQNLALVVGLQGRFDESRQLYAAELAPDQVEANMAYIRALLTQQNKWDAIEAAKG